MYSPPIELSDADLGSLKILQNCDRSLEFGRDATDVFEHPLVVVVRAVREIQPSHVDTSFKKGCQRIGTAGCGPDGGNDLGSTLSAIVHECAA
jgi:hypothetical protein